MISVFDHPWLGGLFAEPECQALFSADIQLSYMLRIEAAYTRALGRVGRVDADAALATAREIEAAKIDMADLREGTARDGVVIPALVRQLKQLPGVSKEAVHKGMTSQDVIDTALAMTLGQLTDHLLVRLAVLVSAIEAQAQCYGDREIMGRTRMQAALPIPLSHRLQTWTGPLEAHKARLSALRPRVALLQMGGPVGTAGDLGEDAGKIVASMADDLGLGIPPLAWHVMREGLADFASTLSLISGSLGKIGMDLCLMAQQGIDEAAFSAVGGSSAMAHKNNPVLAELLVTLARFNATQVSAMHHAVVHEQERSGAAWTLEWMVLPQMAVATSLGLARSVELFGTIKSLGANSETNE